MSKKSIGCCITTLRAGTFERNPHYAKIVGMGLSIGVAGDEDASATLGGWVWDKKLKKRYAVTVAHAMRQLIPNLGLQPGILFPVQGTSVVVNQPSDQDQRDKMDALERNLRFRSGDMGTCGAGGNQKRVCRIKAEEYRRAIAITATRALDRKLWCIKVGRLSRRIVYFIEILRV